MKPRLSTREAADRLGLPWWELMWLIAEGEIECVRDGRRVLIEPDEIERILAAKKQRTHA